MAVSSEDFRHALAHFASGVCVVTTIGPLGELYGITVSAFCSVSLVPPLVLVCVEKAAASHGGLMSSDYFVVNMLTDDQASLSERFAMPAPADFEGLRYEQNLRGIPILEGNLAALECTKKYSYDGGDHTIFVGEVEASRVGHGMPLLYFVSNYGTLK